MFRIGDKVGHVRSNYVGVILNYEELYDLSSREWVPGYEVILKDGRRVNLVAKNVIPIKEGHKFKNR